MAYTIRILARAERDMAHLPLGVRKRVDAEILSLAVNPRPHGSVKIQGREDTYRTRVGDYRVVYEIHDRVLVVLVVRVAHRREAYR